MMIDDLFVLLFLWLNSIHRTLFPCSTRDASCPVNRTKLAQTLPNKFFFFFRLLIFFFSSTRKEKHVTWIQFLTTEQEEKEKIHQLKSTREGFHWRKQMCQMDVWQMELDIVFSFLNFVSFIWNFDWHWHDEWRIIKFTRDKILSVP